MDLLRHHLEPFDGGFKAVHDWKKPMPIANIKSASLTFDVIIEYFRYLEHSNIIDREYVGLIFEFVSGLSERISKIDAAYSACFNR